MTFCVALGYLDNSILSGSLDDIYGPFSIVEQGVESLSGKDLNLCFQNFRSSPSNLEFEVEKRVKFEKICNQFGKISFL